MSKAQDMQNESVVALRGWLDFLDEQDSELRSSTGTIASQREAGCSG